MRPIHSTVILILAACFCAATLHAADTPADANRLAAINNHAVWKDGRPVALPKVSRPAVEGVMLFEPKETDWKYSHHQSITAFKGQLFAIWSSSQRDEDSPGQRVMYAYRNEKGWIQPRILFQPDIEPDGRLRILTAAGFYQHNGTSLTRTLPSAPPTIRFHCWWELGGRQVVASHLLVPRCPRLRHNCPPKQGAARRGVRGVEQGVRHGIVRDLAHGHRLACRHKHRQHRYR